MKRLYNMTKGFPIGKIVIMCVIGSLLYFGISCEFTTEEDESITYYEDYDLSITKYFETNPERFSTLLEILDTTGLLHLFRTYGNYTFLAPNNDAFEAYFAEQGKSSVGDFNVGELTELIRYHVFPDLLLAGSFNSGIVPSKTLTFDYMVSGPTPDGESVLLNKSSRIVAKDEIMPNGIIHEVDEVIIDPQADIYDWLVDHQADFSIFLEAVETTGLDDLLKKDEADSNEFYTGFITPDSKYIESGINSFADLADRFSPHDDNYTDTSNALRSYIASHFTVEIFSMSDASEEHEQFGTVGKASAKFGLRPSTAEVVINYYTSDFPEGLDVDEFNSNNLASNGIIHLMDTMYNIPEKFLRTNFLWILVDVPGLPYDSIKGISIAHVEAGTWLDPEYRYWPRDNGPKHLPFHRTNGWLTLNAPYSGFIKYDDHRRGEWNTPQDHIYGQGQPMFFSFEKCDDLLDVTWKLPYVIPGKYKLLFVTKIGNERPAARFEFDGKPVGGIINMQEGSLSFESFYLGIVDIKEGQDYHYFRHIMVTPGTGFHVAIKLEPVD
jgi:uncharacterized surface protein with fasciclin (FAS1) repeats